MHVHTQVLQCSGTDTDSVLGFAVIIILGSYYYFGASLFVTANVTPRCCISTKPLRNSLQQESRAIVGRTARCCSKFRYDMYRVWQ